DRLANVAIEQSRIGDRDGVDDTWRRFQRLAGLPRGGDEDPDRIRSDKAIIQACAGDIEGALKTAASIPDGLKAWPLQQIAEAQARSGDTESAVQTARHLALDWLGSGRLQGIVQELARTGEFAAAEAVGQMMKSSIGRASVT